MLYGFSNFVSNTSAIAASHGSKSGSVRRPGSTAYIAGISLHVPLDVGDCRIWAVGKCAFDLFFYGGLHAFDRLDQSGHPTSPGMEATPGSGASGE